MEKKSRIQEIIDDVNAIRKCCKFLWKKRRIYITYIIVGTILSLIISYSIPKTYLSSVKLVPETTKNSSSAIAGFADIAGVNLGNMNDGYSVDLYPKIVSTIDFRLSLGDVKVKSKKLDLETSYYDYVLNYNKFPWWSYPKIWINMRI